jgi:hypothetical protein
MLSKYGIVDKEEVKVKLDLESNKNQNEGFKFNMTGWRSFLQGVNWRIQNKEKKSISNLHPKIKKLGVMRDYVNMDELFSATLEIEKVLAKLGKTPFELLKDE